MTGPGHRSAGSAQKGKQRGGKPGGIIQPRVVTCARLYRELRQDQLPPGAEPAEVTQVVGGPAGSAWQADQRAPGPSPAERELGAVVGRELGHSSILPRAARHRVASSLMAEPRQGSLLGQ